MGRKTVYNRVVTDEKYEKVSLHNRMLVTKFLTYFESIGRAESTINSYRSDLRMFFVWMLEYQNNLPFFTFDIEKMIELQAWLLTTLNLSPNRVNRFKYCLSSFSEYIVSVHGRKEFTYDENGEKKENPYYKFENIVLDVPNPKTEPVREKTVLSNDELDKLLVDLTVDGQYQIACAVALAMCSGVRRAEVVRFKTHFFDEEHILPNGLFYKTPEKIETKGEGLNLQYKYTLVEPFTHYYNLWMEEREKLGIKDEYLFVVNSGGKYKKAETHNMDYWAEVINKYTDQHFYWHSLRHYFTTHLYKNNFPSDIIQGIVGWETADMVNIYNDLGTDDRLDIFLNMKGKIDNDE